MPRTLFRAAVLVALVAAAPAPALALRANLRRDLDRLEALGHYEEVLFCRRSTMDMILALHVAWSGAAYDPQMDGLYHETRTDRRYWNLVNGQKREVSALLARAGLTPAQRHRLDDRVRVYIEDHLSPDYDEMGNFYFRRKAWVMERLGLFHDAAFRRQLTGYYAQRVCAPYYETTGLELSRAGRADLAAAYRAKADYWRDQALIEFRRSDGDRRLAEMRGGNLRQRLNRGQVTAALRQGVTSQDADVRLAAIMVLADLDDPAALEAAAKDGDPAIRAVAEAAAIPEAATGLRPGIRARYFTDPGQRAPVAQKALPACDVGFTGNERWPRQLRGDWDKPGILPGNARGQFLLRFDGKLLIPEAGRYRFYVRTEGDNRATVRLVVPPLPARTIIAPRDIDRERRYSVQTDFQGAVLTRVDFSDPVDLQAGLVGIQVEYQGGEARGPNGPVGLRLSWSSDTRVMEPIPARALFHDGDG